MNHILNWIQTTLTRRGFLGMVALGFYHLVLKTYGWANNAYLRVKGFQIRSIEDTQRVDLKTWRLKVEGLVEKPLSLPYDEIQALPQKTQVRNFICVEGWGLDDQRWEGSGVS